MSKKKAATAAGGAGSGAASAGAGADSVGAKAAKDAKLLKQNADEIKKLKEQLRDFGALVKQGDAAAVAKAAAQLLETPPEDNRDPYGVGAANKALEAFDVAHKDDKLGMRAALVADLESRKKQRDAGRPLQVRIADLEKELKAARESRDEAEEGLRAAEEAVIAFRKSRDEGAQEVTRLEGLKRSLLQQSAFRDAEAGSGAAVANAVHEVLGALIPEGLVLLEPARVKLDSSLKDIAALIDQAEALRKAKTLADNVDADLPPPVVAPPPPAQPPAPWTDDEIKALRKMFGGATASDVDGDANMDMPAEEVEKVRSFLSSDEGRKFRRVA